MWKSILASSPLVIIWIILAVSVYATIDISNVKVMIGIGIAFLAWLGGVVTREIFIRREEEMNAQRNM